MVSRSRSHASGSSVTVALVLLALVSVASFEPLKITLHDPGSGAARIGEMIKDTPLQRLSPAHQRRLAGAVPTVGNAAVTTVAAMSDMTGNNAGWSMIAKSIPIGSSIYGPFEAGFSAQQDGVIRDQFGCSNPSSCYSSGGWDTRFAQGACAGMCGVTIPRWENGRYYGFADTCGGHTSYHFHQNMNCTGWATERSGHSAKIGRGTDSAQTPLYGAYENYPNMPSLDACGGHFGNTPDSPSTSIYHNHVQEHPPFTYGCYGPNAQNGLVTIAQCRAINSAVCGTDASSVTTVNTDRGQVAYDVFCPCFDGSGNGYAGAGVNTYLGTTELPIHGGQTVRTIGLFNSSTGASSASTGTRNTPPPPPGGTQDPCFPSTATVTKADGSAASIASLKEGDVIVAAAADGTLTTDTVSLLSIAKPEMMATFIRLKTAEAYSLELTDEHHVPVGAACCSTLKQAKEIAVGETVWTVSGGATVATTVTEVSRTANKGLHSPVLAAGSFPIVEGFVTSFDGSQSVMLASYGLTALLRACKATGTCAVVQSGFAALWGRSTADFIA